MSMLHAVVFKNHKMNIQIIKFSYNQGEYENAHIASIKISFLNFCSQEISNQKSIVKKQLSTRFHFESLSDA